MKISYILKVIMILSFTFLIKSLILTYKVNYGFENIENALLQERWDEIKDKIEAVRIVIDSNLYRLKQATDGYFEDISTAVKNGNFDKLDSISESNYKKYVIDSLTFFGLGYCLDMSGDSLTDESTYQSIFIRAGTNDSLYIPKALPLDYDFRDSIPKSDWYHYLLDSTTDEGGWVEPYYGDNANAVLAEYGKRIVINDTLKGIVYFDYSLFDVKRIVESALDSLPNTVFGYILSEKGKMLYHPNNWLWKRKQLLDISFFGQNQNDECNLCKFSEFIHCLSSNRYSSDCSKLYNFYEDSISTYAFGDRDQMDSRIFRRINTTNWFIVIIYPDYIDTLSNNYKRRILLKPINYFLLLELIIIVISVRIYFKYNKNRNAFLRQLSSITSIILLIDFIIICVISYNYPANQDIQDNENLNFVKHEDCAHSIVSKCLEQESPNPINLGVKIDVLSIRNAHELQIAGYYWLRRNGQIDSLYQIDDSRNFNFIRTKKLNNDTSSDKTNVSKKLSYNDSISKNKLDVYHGIVFPDIMEHRTAFQFVPQVFNKHGDTIYHRRFEAVIKQNFDYSKFPFDNQIIKVRMRHLDFWDKQFLIPDFKYLGEIDQNSMFGINKGVELEEWNLVDTYFAYETKDFTNKSPFVEQRPYYFDDDFCFFNDGLKSDSALLMETYTLNRSANKYPELQFILEIKRQYFRPLIGFMLPVLVILILLYFYVLRIDSYQPGSFLDEGAALLFTLLLSHFALREFLPFKGLIFIEFFYFIVYLSIIIYIINRNIYFKSKNKTNVGKKSKIVSFIGWENNLIAVVLYWPITILLFNIISISFFY